MKPLRHRVRLAAGAVVLGLTLSGCGIFDDGTSPVAAHAAAADGVYDESVLHEISVDLDESDFTAMVETYSESGDKEWITASVTIDGKTFRDAGLRLKGNSSLRGTSTDSEPTELPWLIRLDKFVDGQAYDGWTEFVVRSNSSTTALNEAVALDLLTEAGLASEHAIATSFSVNGADPARRLVVQHLDEAWEEENFSTTGWLYKAEAEGDWSYRGDDAASYVDVFDQETGDDDMTPLMELLDFVNNASDADFAAKLGDHLDVDAFATYLAFQDLIGNWDDIDGPGNNSYLRWDADTEQFTVVAWDHNLAFGGSPGGGMGGGGMGGGRPDGGRGGMPSFGGKRGGRGPMGRSNVLVERFTEVDTFAALVEAAEKKLQADLVDSGRAVEILDARVAVLTEQASDLVDTDTVTKESDSIRSFLSGAAGGTTDRNSAGSSSESSAA